MQKWEYMTVEIWQLGLWKINGIEHHAQGKGPYVSVGLKQWGEEGWDICGVAGSQYRTDSTLFLKRPKP